MTGITGVYFVAGVLSGRNYTALVTSRNTEAVDILALNNKTMRSVGIQIKARSPNQPSNHWLVGEKDYYMKASKAKNLAYVFVKFRTKEVLEYYVIPAIRVRPLIVRKRRSTGRVFYYVYKSDIQGYENKWNTIDSMTK